MGGLFPLFNFNQGNMARKILAHKRHVVDGLEAPRNSLEFQAETSQSCCAAGDEQVEEDWSLKNCYPIEASMKRLINEEISKQSNTKKNAPSIVARLMGVDMLPLDAKSAVQPIDGKNKITRNERQERSSVGHLSSRSKSASQVEFDSLFYSKETDAYRWSNEQKLGKPRHREHPQEEELQKFKKEFEAWQAARFNECSKVVEFGSSPDQSFAQENIKQPKMVLGANSAFPRREMTVEHNDLGLKTTSYERGGLQHHRHKMELNPAEQKESFSSRNRITGRSFDHSLKNYDQKLERSSVPTRIVILKPGPDRIYEHEKSWTSSTGTLQDIGSIEDFLEEVKERLKHELQGKTLKKGSVVRGSGIETPFREKPLNPKQIARHIAKQVRENVTRDLGMNLMRSESTRSHTASDIQFNELGSPEFINRDTRRLLSERLRNVVNKESHLDVPFIVSSSLESSSLFDKKKVRLNQVGDAPNAGNEASYSNWETVKDEQEMQTGSFRHGNDDGVPQRELSPRNLVRSLSAPVSGTSFGKLLLEDRHILTGAQIRRKHEAPENFAVELNYKRKKEKFNIKEKVSNFRYSFKLRGRLFGKKIESMMESHNDAEQNLVRDMMSGPTALMNFGRQIMENSTEVPPSPASVCSNAQEELWNLRPTDYLTPISTPDITPEDGNAMPLDFKEISSNLSELRRQLNQLGAGEAEDVSATEKEEPTEELMIRMDDIEDKEEVYIKELLVASGLYEGSSSHKHLLLRSLAKPISDSVLKQVEEVMSKKLGKDPATATGDHHKEKIDHKMLFDLLNEVLSTLLGSPDHQTNNRLRRKSINAAACSSMDMTLCGRKLLNCVWEIIREYLYACNDNKSSYSLDTMVARNFGTTPWTELVDDEVNELGKEMEALIFGDIIEGIVNDYIYMGW